MRRAARTDSNHAEIVAALRRCGASVQSLASVGDGCPDLLVGYRGRNVLLEMKDGSKAPSARRLTEDEHAWHGRWRGQVEVVENIEDAIRACVRAVSDRPRTYVRGVP